MPWAVGLHTFGLPMEDVQKWGVLVGGCTGKDEQVSGGHLWGLMGFMCPKHA